ncbi:MAG: T9SS type A sorting domain-containing protein [Flavobacteriia bacterium]|nr:T9SS type A sorting domain-containing protein [Flavobacteriia bacterium]
MKSSLVISLLCISISSYAYYDGKPKTGGKGGDGVYNKANCAPARAQIKMDYNDVSALLEPAGLMFLDRAAGRASYEVPKGGKVSAIYAGSLWMGGTDVNGQLKLAAQRFRDSGVDFWTGPLTVTAGSGDYDPRYPVGDLARRDFGEATITPETCLEYDRFFPMSKAEAIQYTMWWECDGNITPAPDNCDDVLVPSNESINRIANWPAHGNTSMGQDYYLAPFYDRNNDGAYNSDDGDSPWYDDIMGRDDVECGVDRRITLFGDNTIWWVFNDKGNIHGETGGDPIGMEIRAQAFTFNTSDEVNRMTFYNYELINRGTQTLTNTYFSQYVDTDLGNYSDDYVGCDVTRGLGYCYNGDEVDEPNANSLGYGEDPPAIGVDFFEGPYQDADGVDNPGPRYVDQNGTLVLELPTVAEAIALKGIVYFGLGIGYGDGVIDNERFGMRNFAYYTSTAPTAQSDPQSASHHYNYMQGLWRDGAQPVYGGTGYPGSGTSIPSSYMLPADSDTLFWATGGTDPGFSWDEVQAGNQSGDRRFVQSAGPFTLKPGAINNITVGIVFASSKGDLLASVRGLKTGDTKAQALFDNCFKIFDPPTAPRLTIQELENELILMIDNPSGNNVDEEYNVEDEINIPFGFNYDRYYNFEGYQIYQTTDENVTPADIGDLSKVRLVAQCDIKNDIDRIVNFEFDDEIGYDLAVERVNGANKGIQHSFRITEDVFASGVRTLVNHKTYYYFAIAYAHNNFKNYDPNDPNQLDGQKRRYVSSRNGYDLGAVKTIPAIPHHPAPELMGTISKLNYGEGPEITRLDGRGNGGLAVDLTQASIDEICNSGKVSKITYAQSKGPIKVKVVDPLNVAPGYFELKFNNYINEETNEAKNGKGIDTASWVVYRYDQMGGTILDSITSDVTIGNLADSLRIQSPNLFTVDNPQTSSLNEQLVPEWGVSIQITQEMYLRNAETSTDGERRITSPLEATIEFKDSSKMWILPISDQNSFDPTNWIRSGTYAPTTDDCTEDKYTNPCDYPDEVFSDKSIDYKDQFSKLLSGGVAPFRLVGYQGPFMPFANPSTSGTLTQARQKNTLMKLPSVDVYITSDKSKWTRCPVLELGRDATLNIGDAPAGTLRRSQSVDKDGKPDGTGTGMGWFPGYAIDVETGVRLYMAFGENSFLGKENGADMIWNPSSNFGNPAQAPLLGGQHAFYVFGNNISGDASSAKNCPHYDPNSTTNWVYDKYVAAANSDYLDLFSNLSWVFNPILSEGRTLLETDVKIRLRVNKEYNDYVATGENDGRPMYSWNMDQYMTEVGSLDQLKSALDMINVVPNPYYAFSEYERNRLDTRVKITNLPDKCTVKIYNISGKLIRTFKKDSPVTSVDWDMKNSKGIPIASGVYLIHVEVPDAGERVIKFFGGVRAIDLENI